MKGRGCKHIIHICTHRHNVGVLTYALTQTAQKVLSTLYTGLPGSIFELPSHRVKRKKKIAAEMFTKSTCTYMTASKLKQVAGYHLSCESVPESVMSVV